MCVCVLGANNTCKKDITKHLFFSLTNKASCVYSRQDAANFDYIQAHPQCSKQRVFFKTLLNWVLCNVLKVPLVVVVVVQPNGKRGFFSFTSEIHITCFAKQSFKCLLNPIS